MAKHVVFDIVGTLACFDAYHQRIDEVIGDKLRSQGLTPQFFGYTWMTHAELEFTFLSVSGRHTSYKDVMKAMFFRILWFAGVKDPRGFATEDERDRCQEGYALLGLREGAKECIEILRSNGFNVWCLTTADIPRVQGYFQRGGVDMPAESILSCDSQGVAKPALAAYKPTFDKFGRDDKKYFAAAHMWDVSAARLVGFKGAYCSAYEKDDCLEIFGGEMEVMGDTLVEMAQKLVKHAE
ncbi:2-haloalkanoic acid dehalogenase like protein [Zymoseptoria brevis]|uniref:2-haloalkanoic acid dehalogenase like protein n=1 Tax=Zymoseptoria brevis TaxID=1047168 RepID=A0A0F4GQ91_9PEZI|nr:2-haloalkanoic acid dehalogenase like protein [Zymoseptoria brevis]